MNRVTLIGRLTRDVDLRYTGNGTAVGSFSLAVNRNFRSQNGEREADFINCVIWRKSAENFANFTHKGAQVGIDGRLQTRSYENQQGQRVYVTEVVVDNFTLLESRAESERYHQAHGNNAPSYPQSTAGNQYGNPMAPQQPTFEGNVSQGLDQTFPGSGQELPNPFANNGQEIDLSDDDLPF